MYGLGAILVEITMENLASSENIFETGFQNIQKFDRCIDFEFGPGNFWYSRQLYWNWTSIRLDYFSTMVWYGLITVHPHPSAFINFWKMSIIFYTGDMI